VLADCARIRINEISEVLACYKLVHLLFWVLSNATADTPSFVVSMSRASSEEIAAASARRTEIANTLLEVLTSDAFTTKELQHFRLVSHLFSIDPVIQELCSGSSTIEARTEKALACAMAALTIVMDDTPPPPTERQLERREARAAAKEFEQRVANLKPAGQPEPAEPEPSAQDKLDRIRQKNRDRQRERRARLKAEKAAQTV
jgi:hypothetical protein